MRTSPFDPWLERFSKEPAATWEGFVKGRRPGHGFVHATVSETLGSVFGGLEQEDKLIVQLDATLVQWLDQFLAWDEAKRQDFGSSNYVYHLDQVMFTVTSLRLPQMRKHLYENIGHYRGILPFFTINSSLDPLAELYRALASSELYGPRLESLWLSLCRDAGVFLGRYYLDIGLLGLKRIRRDDANPPAWLAGLAAWLPHNHDKKLFLRKFRALCAGSPHSPEKYLEWTEPLFFQLERRLGENNERIDWWRNELKPDHPSSRVVLKKKPVARLSSPMPDDLDKILDRFKKSGKISKLAGDLGVLFSQHENFVRYTGDAYFLVRATSVAADFLLKQSRSDAVRLASQLLRRTLIFAPWDIPCWHLLGMSLDKAGQSHAAEWIFWETLRREPNNIPTYTELGRLLVKLGRLDEAEKVFRQALARDPDHIHSRTELGRLLVKLGRLDEAEKVFQQALARDPDDVHIRTELGRLLLMRKRWNEAEKYFQQTLALDPRNGIALAHLKDLQPLRERYEDDGNEILEMLISGYEETVDGNSSVGQKLTDEEKSEYRIFRAPGLAKREDFFIGLRGEGWEPLAQKAKERLGDLLVSDGQNGVVKFFAWRHGLLPRLTKAGETAYTGAQSWSMLEEFAQEENIENRTQKAESLVCHLPGRLRLLVQAAAGKREGWQSLVQWFESVRNHSPKEQSRDLSDASDQFLFNQMRRMILTGVALDPDIMPADSLMRDMCRETAEYLLPSGTEPVVCSETQNLLLA